MTRLLIRSLPVLLGMLILAGTASAQDKDAAATRQMVESKNFVFVAERVNPQSGRVRQLTSRYDLTVRPDSIISFLPYFGRAFTAPINPADGGIKFTSTHFEYLPVRHKKKRWEITIKPRDISDVQELYLTVFDNGRAILSVTSTNRQRISYNGYINEGKPLEKKAF